MLVQVVEPAVNEQVRNLGVQVASCTVLQAPLVARADLYTILGVSDSICRPALGLSQRL